MAAQFNVPYRRLCARFHSRLPRNERQPTNTKLSEVHIKALELYCKRLDQSGMPVLLPLFCAAAETIHRSTYTPAERDQLKPLGRDYITRFIRTHTQFRKVRQKPQETERVFGQERDTETCKISVGFFLRTNILRTDFAGVWLLALYQA